MAVTVAIDEDALDVILTGHDRFWSLHSRIEVPLRRVCSARVADISDARADMKRRVYGGYVRNRLATGRFVGREHKVQFWDVYRGRRVLVVDLRDSKYDRLVLEVHDPEAVAAKINDAIGPGKAKA